MYFVSDMVIQAKVVGDICAFSCAASSRIIGEISGIFIENDTRLSAFRITKII
jgi:hypothetical protein